MAFTPDQLQQLVEAYAERMIENMDTKTMEQFVFDTIVENLGIQSEDDIIEAVRDYYDTEEFFDLVQSVTD